MILPFPGVILCTGPWGYHQGRGRGGNPLPVGKNHTGPSPGLPRRSGRFRGESPERAQTWGGEHRYALLSPTPPPRAGAVQVIPSGKAGQGSWSQIPPFTGVIPHTGPWWQNHPGRGRGGNSLPVEENHTGPSLGLPRRSWGNIGETPGGAQAWESDLIHRSSLSPTRLSPARVSGGSAGDIPWEGLPGVPALIMPFAGIIPCTGLWRKSPGEGPGRELPPR